MGIIDFKLTRLNDFNDVIDYYKKLLGIAKRVKPMKDFTFSNEYKDDSFVYDRILINNIGIGIAQSFDYIEKNAPQNIDELILRELRFPDEQHKPEENEDIIEDYVSSFEEAFIKIMEDNNLTPFETLKQIRNALLHGNYSISFNSNSDEDKVEIIRFNGNDDNNKIIFYGNKEIQLRSSKLVGVLPYEETVSLIDYIFYNIRSRCTIGKNEFTMADSRYISCENEYFLQEYLKSIQSYYIIPRGKSNQGNIQQIISRIPSLKITLESMQRIDGTNLFEIQKIPEEEMKKRKKDIENFIRYVGKNNWKYFYIEGINEDLFDNIFQSRFNENITTISISNSFCRVINLLNSADLYGIEIGTPLQKEMTKLSFEGPLIYSNMILGLLNYGCGYLKANSAEDYSLFEYHNLEGLEGVIPLIDNDRTASIQYGVSGEEKQRKIALAIESYKAQLRGVNNEISRARRQINNLSEKNPNRERMKIELEKSIEEKLVKKEEIMNRIFSLSIRKEEYNEDYIDYSEFFRHLRNSIAHGRYEIEYDRALRCNNFDKIKFTFFDYNEDNIEKNNPDFKVILTASKIMKIMSGLQIRVNSQLNRENQMERIVRTKLEDIIEIRPDIDCNELDEL